MSEISADLYKELLDRMSDGVYFVDRDRRVQYWNEGATRLTGYRAEEVMGRTCHDNGLCHVDAAGRSLCVDECPLYECIERASPQEGEMFLRHKQGRRVPVSVQVQPIREADGNVVGAVQIFRDNTAQIEVRRKAEAMERLAFLDPLTHQPNRRFLEMSVRTALVQFEAHGDAFGLLLFDVNDFKGINDRFGHTSGDRALVEVARTLVGALRSADIVGRWAGDEFLAIAHNVSVEVLRELAERCVMLVEASSFRNNEDGLENLTISVGVALAKPGDSVEKLLARADRRMYEKKKAGSVIKNARPTGSESAKP